MQCSLATWQVLANETSKAGDATPEDDPLKIQFHTKDIGTLISACEPHYSIIKITSFPSHSKDFTHAKVSRTTVSFIVIKQYNYTLASALLSSLVHYLTLSRACHVN